jgi:DoxX
MTDFQFYMTFVLGSVVMLTTLFFTGLKIQRGVIGCSLILLGLKSLINVLALVLPLIGKERYNFFLYTGYYAPNFLLSGELLAWLLCAWLAPAQWTTPKLQAKIYTPSFDLWARIFIATTFIPACISSFLNINEAAAVFVTLGYNKPFMIFIKLLEGICGIGVLFRRTVFFAALLLSFEMAGATYTHYHNYFTRNMPDPFSNSTPSLMLQVFLIAILILSFRRMKPSRVLSTF